MHSQWFFCMPRSGARLRYIALTLSILDDPIVAVFPSMQILAAAVLKLSASAASWAARFTDLRGGQSAGIFQLDTRMASS